MTAEKEKPIQEKEPQADLPVFTPQTDIYEQKDVIYIVTDMPGVEQNDINVFLEDDILTITGRQEPIQQTGYELLHRGYQPGIYRRVFNVLTDIDQNKITANITNGVLRISLPKSEKRNPKAIKVEIE